GNYDMTQMRLLPMAYRYYDDLGSAAREHLINSLLAGGTVRRLELPDTYTRGGPPIDWSRAGYLGAWGIHKRVGETENYILMTMTARYLTNQLIYQRQPILGFDNRRNDPGTLAIASLVNVDTNDESATMKIVSTSLATP